MFKYGEIKIGTTVDYLIMFLFVSISFIIAYVSQLPVLRSQLKEIQESVEAFDDSHPNTVKINQIKKRHQKQLIVFSILILAGILIFLILLISK
jgi:hypothetical protein